MSRYSHLGRHAFFLIILVVVFFHAVARAQNFTTFTEWQVPTAGSEPLTVVPASKNSAFFAERSASKIGFVDMNQNEITEWTLPAGSAPHGLIAQGRNVVFGEQNGHVAVLDPNTSTLSDWTVPAIQNVFPPSVLHVDAQGKSVFFADFGQGVIGRLDSSTDEITLWPMPGFPFRGPNGISVVGPSSKLQVWAADQVGKISMLDPSTNTFTEWTLPGVSPLPQHLDIASDGSVIFQDSNQNRIGALDPVSNIIREWNIPTAGSNPASVASLSPGVVAFTEEFGNKVSTLNTSATPNVNVAVTPTTTTVTPTTFVVTPVSSGLAMTITPVTPTVTGASRTVTGGFIEYVVPTAGSGPVGIVPSSVGALIFTESFNASRKIGRLD